MFMPPTGIVGKCAALYGNILHIIKYEELIQFEATLKRTQLEAYFTTEINLLDRQRPPVSTPTASILIESKDI